MATYNLYNNQIQLVYEKRGRKNGYWIGDDNVMRVTEIAPPIPFSAGCWYGAGLARTRFIEVAMNLYAEIDAALDSCETTIAKYAEIIRKAAGDTTARDLGTEGHNWIEDCIQDFENCGPYPPTLEAQCEYWLTWYNNNKVTPKHIEKKVYSKEYKYAGTLDFAGEVDGKKALRDWKFVGPKAKERPGYAVQTAAYLNALCEENGDDPHDYDRSVLTISENGIKEYKYTNFDADLEAFLHLLSYYRWEKAK